MAQPQEPLNKKIVDANQVAKEIEGLEEDLASLRAAYEQYFLGFERHPPHDKHVKLTKRVKALKGAYVRQTALKFRVNSFAQKVSTYEKLWEKTISQIEAGTYHRDLFKAKLRAKPVEDPKDKLRAERESEQLRMEMAQKAEAEKLAAERLAQAAAAKVVPPPVPGVPGVRPPAPPAVPRAPGLPPPPPGVAPVAGPPGTAPRIPTVAPMQGFASGPPSVAPLRTPTAGSPAVPPVRAAAPPPVRPPPPPQASPAGAGGDNMSDARMKAVYDAYVTAKRRCNEDTSKLSYDAVAANLRKQVPELLKKSGAKGVDFKVVIKDGKAILRAVPKE